MKPLPNFNFNSISTYGIALCEIERHINILRDIIGECPETFSDNDRSQLIVNILWLKRFYEAAERCVLDDK
jgi:hypothetical protein